MMAAFVSGWVVVFQLRYRRSSRVGMITGFSGS
jgi:hypothetical protein